MGSYSGARWSLSLGLISLWVLVLFSIVRWFPLVFLLLIGKRCSVFGFLDFLVDLSVLVCSLLSGGGWRLSVVGVFSSIIGFSFSVVTLFVLSGGSSSSVYVLSSLASSVCIVSLSGLTLVVVSKGGSMFSDVVISTGGTAAIFLPGMATFLVGSFSLLLDSVFGSDNVSLGVLLGLVVSFSSKVKLGVLGLIFMSGWVSCFFPLWAGKIGSVGCLLNLGFSVAFFVVFSSSGSAFFVSSLMPCLVSLFS